MTSLPKFSVDNPVLVGVLMTTILVGGVFSALTLVRELLPETRPDAVLIVTPYPGATPAEVEKGIAKKIEEEIKEIEHIEKVESSITEGLSSILVTMTNDAKDIDLVVNDFKAVVDAIPRDELPSEAEETTVAKFEPRLPVISVAIYGDAPEDKLKQAGRRLEDELQLLPDISDVVLSGIRKGELTVEVHPEKLIEYGTSLTQIRNAIAQSNLDLPGGQLKTAEQNVAVRTLGETDQADLIADRLI
jgi:multidrug efflux pump subunit AcrB